MHQTLLASTREREPKQPRLCTGMLHSHEVVNEQMSCPWEQEQWPGRPGRYALTSRVECWSGSQLLSAYVANQNGILVESRYPQEAQSLSGE